MFDVIAIFHFLFIFFLFQDCGDDSDETNCSENQCEADEFKCGSGKCIARRWICDHDKDCPDGEDEFVRICFAVNKSFHWNNPWIFFLEQNCSFEITTEWIETTEPDRSDVSSSPGDASEHPHTSTTEKIADTTLPHRCGENQFKCNTGICLPRHWICDHVVDCSGGEDELVRRNARPFIFIQQFKHFTIAVVICAPQTEATAALFTALGCCTLYLEIVVNDSFLLFTLFSIVSADVIAINVQLYIQHSSVVRDIFKVKELTKVVKCLGINMKIVMNSLSLVFSLKRF